jgi:hypothetical protein
VKGVHVNVAKLLVVQAQHILPKDPSLKMIPVPPKDPSLRMIPVPLKDPSLRTILVLSMLRS